MKTPILKKPRLVRALLLCLLAGGYLAEANANAQPTLAQALDAAWARSLEAAESRGHAGQAAAERQVSEAWLAGTPTLELSQRQGRGAAAGASETELGLQLPLWHYGQRRLSTQAAQAEQDWARAKAQAARLRLAGQLRDAGGALRAAHDELRQSELQQQLLHDLLQDVARRVRAGDLAPADALAAKAEWLAARSQVAQLGQRLLAQQKAWTLLTGLSHAAAPERAVEPAELEAAGEHPEQRVAELALERARQRVALGQAQRGAQPELGLSLRQEQGGPGPSAQSVALSLRLPLGGDAPQRTQQLAAALAEQELALAVLQRGRLQLEMEQGLARARLQSTAEQAAAERERAGLLRERARLLEQSFKLGETDLPELLRALNAAALAEAAALAREAAHAWAQAQVKQTYGVLP